MHKTGEDNTPKDETLRPAPQSLHLKDLILVKLHASLWHLKPGKAYNGLSLNAEAQAFAVCKAPFKKLKFFIRRRTGQLKSDRR